MKKEHKKENKYDVIVLGAGSGGLNVASFCARIGLRTMIVEKSEEHIGGDCLNYGCIPSKTLIHLAEEVKTARRYGAHPDISIATRIDEVKETIRVRENKEYLEQEKGLVVALGSATFSGPKSILVNGSEYEAKKIVLATGSQPREVTFPHDGSIPMYTNETIFGLHSIPKKMLFLGGGPISCELGQSFSSLGSEVTIVQEADRLLTKEPAWVSEKIESIFKQEGINILCNRNVVKVENGQVVLLGKDGEEVIAVDAIFVGIGRELVFSSLALSKANISLDEKGKGLILDTYLRTTNKDVYAVGDVTGTYMFTHAAESHAKTVITNLFSPIKQAWSPLSFAWITFTSPQVATFGISEETAERQGLTVLTHSYEHEDRAIIDNDEDGEMRVYIDKGGRIYGGTIVAKNAESVAQLLIHCMKEKRGLAELFTDIYPYPSTMRVIKSLAQKYVSSKLTKKSMTALKYIFKIVS